MQYFEFLHNVIRNYKRVSVRNDRPGVHNDNIYIFCKSGRHKKFSEITGRHQKNFWPKFRFSSKFGACFWHACNKLQILILGRSCDASWSRAGLHWHGKESRSPQRSRTRSRLGRRWWKTAWRSYFR